MTMRYVAQPAHAGGESHTAGDAMQRGSAGQMRGVRKVLVVGAAWRHMGRHSGLTPLVSALGADFEVTRTVASRLDRARVLGRKLVSRFMSTIVGRRMSAPWSPFHDIDKAAVETCAIRMLKRGDFDAVLFESIEDYCDAFARVRSKFPGVRSIGISHQPPGWWRLFVPERRGRLAAFDEVICLSCKARDFIAEETGHPRVSFVPHGVDATFFCPAQGTSAGDGFDVLFCGKWLRDFAALEKTVAQVGAVYPDVRFHLVVPAAGRTLDKHYRLARCDSVHWHSGLSDEALRDLYRRAHLLYLPLLDATANNALLEAMACGLPILTDDIGGIGDYVDSTSALFIEAGAGEGAGRQIAWCRDHADECADRVRVARARVESELDWPVVARQIRDIVAGRHALPGEKEISQ